MNPRLRGRCSCHRKSRDCETQSLASAGPPARSFPASRDVACVRPGCCRSAPRGRPFQLDRRRRQVNVPKERIVVRRNFFIKRGLVCHAQPIPSSALFAVYLQLVDAQECRAPAVWMIRMNRAGAPLNKSPSPVRCRGPWPRARSTLAVRRKPHFIAVRIIHGRPRAIQLQPAPRPPWAAQW